MPDDFSELVRKRDAEVAKEGLATAQRLENVRREHQVVIDQFLQQMSRLGNPGVHTVPVVTSTSKTVLHKDPGGFFGIGARTESRTVWSTVQHGLISGWHLSLPGLSKAAILTDGRLIELFGRTKRENAGIYDDWQRDMFFKEYKSIAPESLKQGEARAIAWIHEQADASRLTERLIETFRGHRQL